MGGHENRPLFQDGFMSVGVVLPIKAGGDSSRIDIREQLELATVTDDLGFDAIWVRDVPLNGPWYPEDFGHPDPVAMLAAISDRTKRVRIGTAALVLPLRHPLHVAKAATSLNHLSGGRFILGVGSGDRREEFAAFGVAAEDHKVLYKQHLEQVISALTRPDRIVVPDEPDMHFELRPPLLSPIEVLAIGSGGQTLEWIARNLSGWATYFREPARQRDRYALWRQAVDRHAPDSFKSFSVAMRIELEDDVEAPAVEIDLGYRTGARSLPRILAQMMNEGTHHVMLNILSLTKPADTALRELADAIIPNGAAVSARSYEATCEH